jgi:Xaa-Pro dipeptidase
MTAPGDVQVLEGTGPLIAPLPFSDGEFERRLSGLRSSMAEHDLDAFISFTPENIYYLTAHDTPGYYFYQACVVTPQRAPINVLRRLETTNTLGRSWTRLAVSYEDREDPIERTLAVLRELDVISKRIGVETDAWFISPERYLQLQDGVQRDGGCLVDASGIIEGMRITKSDEELVHIRAAARIAGQGMQAAVEASHAGTNESTVAAATVAALIRAGSEYAGLPPFLTSGPRTSLAHATWDGRTYETGDVLAYELPGVVNRYCAALFRCGTVGQPDPEISQRAAMVCEALESVVDAIRPGATSHEVHSASKLAFERAGYGHLLDHRTGYSIGINYPPDWGEGQIISIWEGDERPLQAGMTFHLVPGFLDLGRYAIIISETVLVTETGCEVLTDFPRDLFVV